MYVRGMRKLSVTNPTEPVKERGDLMSMIFKLGNPIHILFA